MAEQADVLKKAGLMLVPPAASARTGFVSGPQGVDFTALKKLSHAYTDLDRARRFADYCHHKLLWCDARGWLRWTGSYWEEDTHAARLLAGQWADAVKEEALQACGAANGEEQQKLAQGYMKESFLLRSRKTMDAVVMLAQAELVIAPDKLDANAFLLNTPDGEVDLRTSDLRPHQPDSFCTMITSVGLGRTAKGAAMWADMIRKVTVNDSELADYLQTVCGMIAIGKVLSENTIFAYGGGSNLKSTFWNVIHRVLNLYAICFDPELLTTSTRNPEVAMATFRGKRFALSGEFEEGKRLSTSTLKRLASTDPITAKRLYCAPETFIPTHSIVVYTNHLPKVGSVDRGTWRRIAVVPFNAQMGDGEKILNYADVLFEQAGGAILAWIIEGARMYVQADYKLPIPAAVRAANDQYHEASDWMQNFLDECCELEAGARAQGSVLYQAYRQWAEQNGEYTRRQSDFVAALASKGFKNVKPQRQSWWIGLKMQYKGLGGGL